MNYSYEEKSPILITQREIESTRSSPVIEYKLTPEELKKYDEMLGPIKKNAKKTIALGGRPNKKVEGEKMEEKKQSKRLTFEELENCLNKK